MPFSPTTDVHSKNYWNNHFSFFLKENIQEIGTKNNLKINVERSSPIRGNVSNKIIFDLIQSDIVIADLTDFNRNVMWELGVRQSFKNSTILIGEEGTEKNLPFDISKIALLPYNIDHNPKNPSNISFIDNLEKVIIDCINNPDRSDSPVLESMSGRGTFYELITKQDTLRKIEGLITECEYNKKIIGNCLESIEDHKKEKSEHSVPTNRIRIESIALLMTNRYINEKPIFYDEAGLLFLELDSIDKVLEAWVHVPDSDEHLEGRLPDLLSNLNNLSNKIRNIHERIQNTY